MKYTNKEHTTIQDGDRSFPCNLDNRHYKQIVDDGLLDSVEAYVEPEKSWEEKRTEEYGKVTDQLDEIYHDIDAWKLRIAGVKTSHPKP
tara:strand:- start:267 stop:533 length:267 start_codon:yes stop_codon:yes gene_type:complete